MSRIIPHKHIMTYLATFYCWEEGAHFDLRLCPIPSQGTRYIQGSPHQTGTVEAY